VISGTKSVLPDMRHTLQTNKLHSNTVKLNAYKNINTHAGESITIDLDRF